MIVASEATAPVLPCPFLQNQYAEVTTGIDVRNEESTTWLERCGLLVVARRERTDGIERV